MNSINHNARRLGAAILAAAFLGLVPGVAVSQPCDFTWPPGERVKFPDIPICAFPGAYQDSSLVVPNRCVGRFVGPLPDSVRQEPRTITVRFLRDRVAEAREDFGGYRIYRVTNTPDSTRMVMIRRFSRQAGDERTWNFSSVRRDTTYLPGGGISLTYPFICNGRVVHDSVVTFVDPDSSGNYVKVCRDTRPPGDPQGACYSIGDSIFILNSPPGPHDGFLTWYAVTYEAKNLTLDATYEELFVADTLETLGPCAVPGDPKTCYNLNNKLANVIAHPVEPTGGPLPNLERVAVVPNPYRGIEAWDRTNTNEIHFINLPSNARIRIYTVSGDLVADLDHTDPVRDFTRWDLKNDNGLDVASGIYMYRVEANGFEFQDRFVVIR